MKVLIIGGTGILSTAVVDECVARGYEVTMVNRGSRVEFINKGAKLIKCDFKNKAEVESLLRGKHFDTAIDFLIWNKEHLSYSLSVIGHIADQYIYISSAQAYNTSNKGILTESSELIQPLWGYSVNKVMSEEFLKEYSKREDINYTIVRPGVNYGSTRIPYGMFPNLGQHWTFVERIKAGKPIITWNQGQNKLNLTRVEDFAAGMVRLIGNPKAYNEIFNVVGDNVYTWKDVLSVLGGILGCDVKTIDLPTDFYANELDGDERESLLGGRACDLVCSNEKMKRLNPEFKTKYSIEEGIRMTLKFYQDNNYYHGIDYVWDGECDRIINKYTNSKKYKFTLYNGTSSVRAAKVDYYTGYYKTIFLKKAITRLLLKIHP